MLNTQNYSVMVVGLYFDCNTMHCRPWSNYMKGKHWDYYSETNGDCHNCKQLCHSDAKCGAIECGSNYCSWWKKEICKVGNFSDSDYFTCRRSIEGIYRSVSYTHLTLPTILRV